MKRTLMVSTVAATIGQFNMDNIQLLNKLGYKVDVACDYKDESIWLNEREDEFKNQIERLGGRTLQVDFSRNAANIKSHIRSLNQISRILKKGNYCFVHTHTPIASAIVRAAAHKTGTKVIYTAHGFHFYTGAPIKNWLIYYPIEEWLSRYTDVLITINKEDYKRASRHFKAKKTVYVPGVGIDTERFAPRKSSREKIRKELGLKEEETMLLSVGELNKNKNHASVIRAIAGLNFTYVIAGEGELKSELKAMAKKYRVDLRLVGFRNDIADFYNAADVYILPSIREGLNVSLMEAMASGLPAACGDIRGNRDLIESPLFNPVNPDEIRTAIITARKDREELKKQNMVRINQFDKKNVNIKMSEIYSIF